jgi:hypothetical protein
MSKQNKTKKASLSKKSKAVLKTVLSSVKQSRKRMDSYTSKQRAVLERQARKTVNRK